MILLIDAYNVLKQAHKTDLITEQQRNNFVHQLGQYLKVKQHKGILVFDGGQYDRATQERISGVYVVYSGVVESADEYIKRYIKKHEELDILLVSSDRELRSEASRYNIESIPSQQFFAIVQEFFDFSTGQSKKTSAIKLTKKEDPELDKLMQEGSKKVPRKVEDFIEHRSLRKSKAHRLSKKERAKEKKIKKLT